MPFVDPFTAFPRLSDAYSFMRSVVVLLRLGAIKNDDLNGLILQQALGEDYESSVSRRARALMGFVS